MNYDITKHTAHSTIESLECTFHMNMMDIFTLNLACGLVIDTPNNLLKFRLQV